MKDKEDSKKIVFNDGPDRVAINNSAVINSGDIISYSGANDISFDYSALKAIMALPVTETNINGSLVLSSHSSSIGSISNLNANNNVNINFSGHSSVLTLSGSSYNHPISVSDPNSTGTISINPDLTITLNGRIGTTEHPIGTLVVGNNSTLTITDHLYVNSLTLCDGASVVPPEMVHVVGNNGETQNYHDLSTASSAALAATLSVPMLGDGAQYAYEDSHD